MLGRAWLTLGPILTLVLETAARADDVPTFADRGDDAIQDADATRAVLVAPLAIACGVVGGEADLVVKRAVALEFDGAAFRSHSQTVGALGAGLLVYPLRPAFHDLYFEAHLVYAHALSAALSHGPEGFSVEAVAGWQWTWDYGLSLRLGAGLAAWRTGLEVRSPELTLGPLALVAAAGIGWTW